MNWMPAVIEESSLGAREIPLFTKLLSNRKIFISGEITEELANNFVSEMLFLTNEKEPIDIYINSYGGIVQAGLTIYDTIRACDIPINIYCTGCAYSMAAIILAGGQKGRRYLLPHAKIMIHEPLIQGGIGGSASSIEKVSESIVATRGILNKILSESCGKSLKEINKATAFNNYMGAAAAITFGLADEIRNII